MLDKNNTEPLFTAPEKVAELSPEMKKIMDESSKAGAYAPGVPAKKPLPEWLVTMNHKHAVVRNHGKVSIMNFEADGEQAGSSISFSKVSDYKSFYLNKYDIDESDGNPRRSFLAPKWLMHPDRRQYTSLVFAPGKAQELPGRCPGELVYNLFRGFSVTPVKGDCSLFWDHVKNIVCARNKKHYIFVRKWMAHAVQKPWEVPGTALVMRGGQGTGKGTLANFLGKLFKENFITVTQSAHLTGKFNAHMAQALVVFADEVVWGGDKECAGALKAMISEKLQSLEYKGQDVISFPNFRRFLIASNGHWCVPVEADDRRFVILDVSSRRQGDRAYFNALNFQMENGGLEALMYDLLQEDLTDFDHSTKPKVVSGGQFDLKLRTMDPTPSFWHEYLTLCDPADNESGWRTVVSKEGFHEEYLTWCKRKGHSHPDRTVAIFAKTLGGMVKIRNTRPAASTQTGAGFVASVAVRNGISKRVQMWDFPTLQECRKQFETYIHEGPYIWTQK